MRTANAYQNSAPAGFARQVAPPATGLRMVFQEASRTAASPATEASKPLRVQDRDPRQVGGDRAPRPDLIRILRSSTATVVGKRAPGAVIAAFSMDEGGSLKIEGGGQHYCAVYLGISGSVSLSDGRSHRCVPEAQLQILPLQDGLTLNSRLSAQGILLLAKTQAMQSRLCSESRTAAPSLFWGRSLDLGSRTRSLTEKLLYDCLSGLYGHLWENLAAVNAARMSELLLTLLAEALAETGEPVAEPEEDGAPWYVHQVEKYILDGLCRQITVTELARVTGVSPRTLHEGFRKHRGYSPMQFLRDQRMSLIRKELTKPEGNTSVTDAALKWGFTHLGRFSSYYLAKFGEKPSATLLEARLKLK